MTTATTVITVTIGPSGTTVKTGTTVTTVYQKKLTIALL